MFANLLNTQLGVGIANTFIDPTGTPNLVSNFGAAAALSGNGQTLLIGAPGANAGGAIGAGQVVFYSYNAVSKTWSAPTVITDPAATAGDAFGVAVALSADGQTALVGAYTGGVGVVPVYVFTLSGGVWTQAQKFTGVNTFCQNCLALSADGQTAIISTDTGANIYTTASAWSSFLTVPITAPNGGGDGSVAITAFGNSVLVGTIGRVYQYNLSGGVWGVAQHFDDPAPDPSDGFGQTGVALSADQESMVITAGYATVTVGANAFAQAGVAYVYQSPADLSLTLSASPSLVALNQTVTLNATVTNNDAVVSAYNVSFTYTIPDGLSLVATNPVGGTCSLSLNKTGQTVVTCVAPSLQNGDTWQPQVLVKVTTAGAYTNTASVTSNQPDPDTANNTASASISMLPPTVSNGNVSTHVGVPVSGTLNGSNPCLCGTPVFSVVTVPAHGSVSITNTTTGAFTYTPAAGYIGSDSFTFQLANGLDTSGAATESITVADVAPTANNGSVSTTMNQPVSATLSATPGYAGQVLTYSVVTSPAHGSVSLTASSGAFTYTPTSGYTGSDSFTFTVGDGTLTSAIATESITVNAGGGGGGGGGGGALGFLSLVLLGELLALIKGRRFMR
ncbi:MAG: cadherin-like domain-containing protein [Gammaproteobacteria bacterium]|nr:cadherin-like domain-containing protein [Gammaproteobacteria bacterium]